MSKQVVLIKLIIYKIAAVLVLRCSHREPAQMRSLRLMSRLMCLERRHGKLGMRLWVR